MKSGGDSFSAFVVVVNELRPRRNKLRQSQQGRKQLRNKNQRQVQSNVEEGLY